MYNFYFNINETKRFSLVIDSSVRSFIYEMLKDICLKKSRIKGGAVEKACPVLTRHLSKNLSYHKINLLH